MYIHRYLEKEILQTHKTFKVLYVGGPRQVGKTTILKHLAEKLHVRYVSLDDISVRQIAKADPKLFIQDNPAPVLIDEIQYVPELLPYIKMQVDNSNKNGQYWLTGSQQFNVMKNVQESLAGRVGILYLLGLSFGEAQSFVRSESPFLPATTRSKNQTEYSVDSTTLYTHIVKGSFPALYGKDAPKTDLFYSSYLQTYIDRDLRDLYGVSKLEEFHRFVQLCAGRTAQVLNYSDLARDAGISVHAAKEWIGILENTMQIYLLKPYFPNFSKRIIKAPKMYFLDTGFAAYLTKWKSAETLKSGAMAGAFFETFIVSELIKSYLFRGQEPPFYYFRDKEGHEVDMLIEKERLLYPVEIKLASHIKKDDIKTIEYLAKKVKNIGHAAVICLTSERYRVKNTIEAVPFSFVA